MSFLCARGWVFSSYTYNIIGPWQLCLPPSILQLTMLDRKSSCCLVNGPSSLMSQDLCTGCPLFQSLPSLPHCSNITALPQLDPCQGGPSGGLTLLSCSKFLLPKVSCLEQGVATGMTHLFPHPMAVLWATAVGSYCFFPSLLGPLLGA